MTPFETIMGRVELDFDVDTWLSPGDSVSQFGELNKHETRKAV